MGLVAALLASAVALGLAARRIGPGVYAALFVVASIASIAFMLVHQRLYP